MAQVIEDPTRGSIFGRIGKGLGQGLSEQIPKEVERYRLSSGLKNLAKNAGNLSPLEQAAEYLPLLQNNPAALQILPSLLAQQNYRNEIEGYANANNSNQNFNGSASSQNPNSQNSGQGLRNVDSFPQNLGENLGKKTLENLQNSRNKTTTELNPTNPTDISRLPKSRWSPQKRLAELATLSKQFRHATPERLEAMASDKEARELGQPEDARALDQYLEQTQEKLNTEFYNQLENKLEATDKKGVYKDISGANIEAVKKIMAQELATDPNATIKGLGYDYSEKLLELSRAKNRFKTIQKTDFLDSLNPSKKKDKFDQLNSFSRIYKDTGNSSEFHDKLISQLGMSPHGADFIAYPPNDQIKSYAKNIKPSNLDNRVENGTKYAKEVAKNLKEEDSISSILFHLRQKDPFFNQNSFMNYFRDNPSLLKNKRQETETATGEMNVNPSWGDFSLIPLEFLNKLQ